MQKQLRWPVALLIAGIITAIAAPASASTDPVDLAVGMKTLALLQDKIQGVVNVAIVFDPRKEESRADAQTIKTFFDDDRNLLGGIKSSTRLVSVDALKEVPDNTIVILAWGLDSDYNAISMIASAKGLLTMSSDLNCVRANKCVLGIVSKPNVEIYYSRTAAEASKIVFAQAFTMLVKLI